MVGLTKKQTIIIISLLLSIFLFYLWRASISSPLFFTTTITSNSASSSSLYYTFLTEAFLRGQFHLPIDVPDELLTLEDSHDPIANKKFRYSGLADISLYKGKFYLYWGVTPILVLHIPIYLLTKLRISDTFAISVFMWGSVLWAVLLLLYLRSKYFGTIPIWMIYISVPIVGFANLGPYLLNKALPHGLAISCGVFFLTGAVYLLCTTFSDNLNFKKIALSSLFLGLSVMSRPNFCIVSVILILFVLFRLVSNNNWNSIITKLLALILPFVLCIGWLAYYNYARFDEVREFGLSYQLTTINSKKTSKTKALLSIKRVGGHVTNYLFFPPIITKDFPFLHPNSYLSKPQASLNFRPFREDMVGLISGYPFILVLFLAPLINWLYSNKNKFTLNNLSYFKFELVGLFLIAIIDFAILQNDIRDAACIPAITTFFLLFIFSPLLCWHKNRDSHFFKFEFWIVFLVVFINYLFLLLWGHITYRYLADVNTRLIILCLCLWFYCDHNFPAGSVGKSFLRFFAVATAAFSVFTGFALSF